MSLQSYIPQDHQDTALQSQRDFTAMWQQGANINAGTVNALASIKRNYSWLSAGAALSMAQAGYTGYSPEVDKAAQLELQRKLRSNQYKQLLTSPNLLHDMSKVPSAIYNSFTPAQRQALKEKAAGTLDSGGDDLLGDLSYSVGRLAHSDVAGAIGGPSTAVTGPMDVNPPHTGISGDIYGTASGITREAGVGANSLYQFGQANLRGVAQNIEDISQGNFNPANNPGVGDTQRIVNQTDVGQQLNAVHAGTDPFATGSGLLPDPNSPILKAQAQAAREGGPTIGGHAFTPGRALAAGLNEVTNQVVPNTIFEPDHTGFNLVSGLVDATSQVKTDPTLLLMNDYSAARKAGKFFSPELTTPPLQASGADLLDTALRDSGHTFTANRYGLKAQQWDQLLNSDQGTYLDQIDQHFGPDIRASIANDISGRAVSEYAINLAKNNGLVLGGRPTVLNDTARGFADNVRNNGVWIRLSKLTSPSEIIRDFRSASGQPLDIEVAKQFAASATPEEAKQVFLDGIGKSGLQGPFDLPTPGSFSYSFRHGIANHALFGMTPENAIQMQNPDATLDNLDRIMQNVHMPIDQRTPLLDDFINAPGELGRQKAVVAISKTIEHSLLQNGIKPEQASVLSRLFPNAVQRSVDGITKLISSPLDNELPLTYNGETTPLPTADDMGLWANEAIPMPNARDLRRASSAFAPLVNHPAWTGSQAVMDAFMENLWKPVKLLKEGLIVKIFGDSQASLGANGLQSWFNHPIHAMSAMAGANPDGWMAKAIANNSFMDSTYISDGVGMPIFDGSNRQVLDSLYGGLAAYKSPAEVAMRDTTELPLTHPKAATGLVDTLFKLHADEVNRGVLTEADPRGWFWEGEGKPVREAMIPTADAVTNSSRAHAKIGNIQVALDNPTGSDAFIQDAINKINVQTGGHPELLDAVRTGHLNGVPLWKNNGLNRYAIKQAQGIIDEQLARGAPDILPSVAYPVHSLEYEGNTYTKLMPELARPTPPTIPDTVRVPNRALLSNAERNLKRVNQDGAVEWMFNQMLTNPDVKFDRNFAFQQTYWGSQGRAGQIDHYIPYLSPNDYETIMSNAEAAKLPPEVLSRLKSIPLDGTADRIPLNKAVLGAQSDTLREIPKLVHDLHSRSNFADMMRLIAPFGDAFRRIASRWATNIWENPETLRKFQLGMNAARQSGFFHTLPNGDEVFTMAAPWLTDKLIGVPIPMTGRVSGLSAIGEGIPGFGPAVSLSAKWFLPDTPQYDGIRKAIFPNSSPYSSGNVFTDLLQEAEPAWFSKLVQGPPDTKAFNNTVGTMADELRSSGEYDLYGPNAASEQARLLSDAKDKARWLYVIQGVAQFVSPTTPTPQAVVKDKTGHWVLLDKVRQDYNDQAYGGHGVKAAGPDGALRWLVHRYGVDNLFVPQSFSHSLNYSVPMTKEANDWAREHQDLKAKYPEIYGLLAPSKGKQDVTTIAGQYERGERASDSPEEQQKRGNNRIGQWQYHIAKDRMIKANGGDPLDSDQLASLKVFKKELMQKYPGFNLIPFDDKKIPQAIIELTKAAKDPKVQGTDAGKGLARFLDIRQRALDAATTEDVNAFKSADGLRYRIYLRDEATQIANEHPDFLPMWEQVFSREMKKDS